jgi:hypothetical protein
MSIDLSIEQREGYLRFELRGKRVLGEFGPEMLGVWSRLAREAERTGIELALGVSHLTGAARVADIYDSAIAAVKVIEGVPVKRVAIVIAVGGIALEENRLAETVAASRGLTVRMFAAEAAALEWLLQPGKR